MKDLDHPADFERALWPKTATERREFPTLDGEFEADVAIVGGGFTGLSAALHLARSGKRPALLEAHEMGHGASGRNAGGFLPFYLDRTPQGVRKLFGDGPGEALNQMVASSGRLMCELIDHYRIDADVRSENLILGGHDPRPTGRARLLDLCAQWRISGQDIDVLEREEMLECTGTNVFAHGLRFHDSGTLNPMSLSRGLARAAGSEGAHLFAQSAATHLTRRGSDWCVRTARGSVIARQVLLATDGYSANRTLCPALEKTMYRVPAAIVASKPSAELKRMLSPQGRALADDHTQSHLYMMFDAQSRLVASLLPPPRDDASPAEVARPFERKLRRVFPHLPWRDMPAIEWQHFWLGTVAFTAARVPCAIRLEPGLHSVGGYSGQGITAAIAAGKEFAQFILGGGREASCRLPFVNPQSVPMRRALPYILRTAIVPLIHVMDRTYRG